MKSSPIPTSRPADRLPRDRRIDLCYVIGILLVVAGHSGVDPRFASTALFRWIYAFHMPLFFALSGYLFRYGGGSGRVGAGLSHAAVRCGCCCRLSCGRRSSSSPRGC